MKISIVTISYNQAKFLEEAILSVISQEGVDIEYIVIDGGSSDDSIEVIKKYENQLAYWVSEKDNGPANALNKGFEKATGDFFFYLNSDDRLMPNALLKVKRFIEQHPGFDFYYGHGYMSKSTYEHRYKVYSDRWSLNGYRQKAVGIFQQSTFIRREMFRKVRGFNEDNTTHWDGELLVDLALAGAKFCRHPYHIGFFRIHDLSLSGGMGNQTKYRKNLDRINKGIQDKYNFPDRPRCYYMLRKLLLDPKVAIGRFLVKTFRKE